MRQFIVKQLGYDLTPVAGLALVGHHLQRLTPVFEQIDRALPVKTGVTNSDILRSYVGLLVQGKSDFDATRTFAATLSSSRRWASSCCPPARRCASAWTRAPVICSISRRR